MAPPNQKPSPWDKAPHNPVTPVDTNSVGGRKARPRIGLSDATPQSSPFQEKFIRVFAVMTLLYTAYYLFWRWTESLNPDAIVFSVALLTAETYAFVAALLMTFTVWELRRRQPGPAPEGLAVDVFVTVFDEPLDVLRRTVLGAREIDYPHRTYVLDDGKRDEVQALAEELDIGYIRRDGNEHAKAGNLNNALKETEGEFILQLDADHVPLPHILDRLLGFFADPEVGFVQSPQDFYNTDSFTHSVDELRRRMWEEQKIFFSLIQPGKDHWNAAFFCGSCGVIRRKALEEIGGFSTETITEDMETSLLLHARGWKSAYYAESLAFGLAPGSAGAFHVQRLRWGQGSMQILRKFNPLFHKGLSIPQRLCYFSSTSSYLEGLQNLMLYVAPLIFFYTGAFPIRAEDSEFLIRFVPYLLLSFLMFELLSRGTGYVWISARYSMAKFFTYLIALSGFFARGKLKFNVTPKGPGHVPFKTYAPQLALMLLSLGALGWALSARQLGLIDYDVPGWSSLAFWLNLVWLAINFGLAAYVVRHSLKMQQQRNDHRFADQLAMRVRLVTPDGPADDPEIGISENLNSHGLAFRSLKAFPLNSRVRLTLPLSTGDVTVDAIVLHQDALPGTRVAMYQHGVEFVDVGMQVRDTIEMHCIQHAVPIWQLQYRTAVSLFDSTMEWFRRSRKERRQRVHLPVEVQFPEGARLVEKERISYFGVLEEISTQGARLLLDRPVSPGTLVQFGIPSAAVQGLGEAIFSTAMETSTGVRFMVGLQRRQGDVETPGSWPTYGQSSLRPADRARSPRKTA